MANPLKSLFKGKGDPKQNLQQLQQEFNQTMFRIGDLTYRKTMVKAELSKMEQELQSLTAKADKMGVDAMALRQRIQEELKQTVSKGEKNASKESSNSVPEQD